jgi:hypothetical protein
LTLLTRSFLRFPKEANMMLFETMEPQPLMFLYERYKRSEGDARRGIPYAELVDALGLGERITKSIQRDLQQEGLVELTSLPQITNVVHTVIDHEHRRSSRQTIGMTHDGVQLLEDISSSRAHTESPNT